MSQNLRLVAIVDLKSGSVEKVLPAVLNCVRLSMRERGNLFYSVHHQQNNSNRLVFVEHWTSEEAIDEHAQTEHFQTMMKTLEPYLERPMELLPLIEIKAREA